MPRPLAIALPQQAGWARTALEQAGLPVVAVDGRIDRYALPPDEVCETVAERDAKYAGMVGQSIASWHVSNVTLRLRRCALAARRRLLRAVAGRGHR